MASVLLGCAAPVPLEPDRFFALEPSPPAPVGVAPRELAVQVRVLVARGFLGGRQIVFRTAEDPLQVQRYRTLLWAEPPPRALAQALVDGLRAARLVRLVSEPADRSRVDRVLSGTLEVFEHRPTAQPPQVRVRATFQLVSARERLTLWNHVVNLAEPVEGQTPDDMAAAFNRLTARLVEQVVHELARHWRGASVATSPDPDGPSARGRVALEPRP